MLSRCHVIRLHAATLSSGHHQKDKKGQREDKKRKRQGTKKDNCNRRKEDKVWSVETGWQRPALHQHLTKCRSALLCSYGPELSIHHLREIRVGPKTLSLGGRAMSKIVPIGRRRCA